MKVYNRNIQLDLTPDVKRIGIEANPGERKVVITFTLKTGAVTAVEMTHSEWINLNSDVCRMIVEPWGE
jgi:hypothetical protein